jgi:hypothetical protein
MLRIGSIAVGGGQAQMYKCFDKSEQKDVIILDAEDDEEAISALRQKSRARELLCPECRQAVQARAGNINAWHFAHLDLGACPLQSESGAVLKARRLLYEWLVLKFVERPGLDPSKKAIVTLEKKLSPDLPRPVDCYVEHPDGRQLVYWIFEAGCRNRDALKVLSRSGHSCHLNPVFLHERLRTVPDDNLAVDLSPTERDFLGHSEYNKPYNINGHNLHYLCGKDGTMTTLRGLELMHPPQRYSFAVLLKHPLKELLTTAQGEFIHPGESEKMVEFKQQNAQNEQNKMNEKARLARLQAKSKSIGDRLERRRVLWQTPAPVPLRESRTGNSPMAPCPVNAADLDKPTGVSLEAAEPIERKKPEESAASLVNRHLRCEICGQVTRDWSYGVPDKGICKCRSCMNRA